MSAKVKNDPNKYMTRAKLGAAGTAPISGQKTKEDAMRATERISEGTLDDRWYIKLFPDKCAS